LSGKDPIKTAFQSSRYIIFLPLSRNYC